MPPIAAVIGIGVTLLFGLTAEGLTEGARELAEADGLHTDGKGNVPYAFKAVPEEPSIEDFDGAFDPDNINDVFGVTDRHDSIALHDDRAALDHLLLAAGVSHGDDACPH